jgi:hypothetical protein
MTKDLKRFEQWWDAGDDIPNDGPYTPDTPIQFAWAGWQAALAQPVQKPVAIALNTGTKQGVKWLKNVEHGEKLYTTPPQRTWVGLSDDEYTQLWGMKPDLLNFFRKIEAKLKEKNT